MMSGIRETESAWWQLITLGHLIMLGYQGLLGKIAAEFEGATNSFSPQTGLIRSLNSLGNKHESSLYRLSATS